MAGVFVDKLKADGQGLWDKMLAVGKLNLFAGLLAVVAVILWVMQFANGFDDENLLIASVVVSVAAAGLGVYGVYQKRAVMQSVADEINQVASDVANVPALVEPVAQ